MTIGAGIFFAILGLIVGSFLNVVILRMHTGRTLSGRSQCMHCGHTLSAVDLVPVISYLFFKGKCRYCGSAVSAQYVFVEVLTSVLFVLAALLLTGISLVLQLVAICLVIVIAVYDFRHTIIPDVAVYLLIALSLLLLVMGDTPSTMQFMSGFIVAVPLFLLWLISSGRWMGLGDAKLALALGWLLSPSGAFTLLLLAFWIGAIASLMLLYIPRFVQHRRLFGASRALTMKSEVAFGPFLAASYFVVWLSGFDITSFILF